jgi:hypothetical protein
MSQIRITTVPDPTAPTSSTTLPPTKVRKVIPCLAFLKVKSIPVPTKSGYKDEYFFKGPQKSL